MESGQPVRRAELVGVPAGRGPRVAHTATWVIPGGASGDPESPHFADQLPEWAEHRRIPMID